MRKLRLNLSAALLAFGLGILVNFSLDDSNSIDRRLESRIRRVEGHNMRKHCKGGETAEKWAEKCKEVEEYVKVNNRYPSSASMRIEGHNKSCEFNKLSDEECDREKEESFREIGKFLISENVIEER